MVWSKRILSRVMILLTLGARKIMSRAMIIQAMIVIPLVAAKLMQFMAPSVECIIKITM